MLQVSNARGWVRASLNETNAPFRLFCLPYSGSGAMIFRSWARWLAPEIEVCPIQLPGREDRLREPAFTHLEPLIDELSAAMLPYLDRPFAIFGHSLGGFLGFALAQRLNERYYQTPLVLFVSACRAPIGEYNEAPMHRLPEERFLEQLTYRYGTLPPQILANPDLLALYLQVLRADFAVLETYSYAGTPEHARPLPCPIITFGGTADKAVTPGHLERWQVHTDSNFNLKMLEGDHFLLKSCQNELLGFIKTDLTRFARLAF
jgi:medium-chain acyl-[acyl-carrier-protein] hydrolase